MKRKALEQVVIKKEWKRRKSEIQDNELSWVDINKFYVSDSFILPLILILEEFYKEQGEEENV